MSLLWHNVWLLQYLPSSTKPTLRMIIGRSISYWIKRLYKIQFTPVIFDEVHHQHVKLRQIDEMHRQEVQRSSPSPIPTTHKRGEESTSMSVVSASSSSAAPWQHSPSYFTFFFIRTILMSCFLISPWSDLCSLTFLSCYFTCYQHLNYLT